MSRAFADAEITDEAGRVTTCTATDCAWNRYARCTAPSGVMVNFHHDHADCNTYTQNRHIPGMSPEEQH